MVSLQFETERRQLCTTLFTALRRWNLIKIFYHIQTQYFSIGFLKIFLHSLCRSSCTFCRPGDDRLKWISVAMNGYNDIFCISVNPNRKINNNVYLSNALKYLQLLTTFPSRSKLSADYSKPRLRYRFIRPPQKAKPILITTVLFSKFKL